MENSISNKLRELFYSTHQDVSVGFGYKTVNNEFTDEKSIVFMVPKKLPLSEIPENEVFPLTIEIDGIVYNTDVIELEPMQPLVCDNSITNPCFQYGYPPVAENTPNSKPMRPLKGGCALTSVIGSGTLGFIAKHTATGKLVGVTNAHVMFNIQYNYRSIDYYSGKWTNPDALTPNNVYNTYPRVQNLPTSAIFGNTLYVQKWKARPFINNIDAGIVSLLQRDSTGVNLITSESWKQVGLDIGTTPPPFATTQELDNILSYPNLEIASSGLRTGPKQGACGLKIIYSKVYMSYIGMNFNNIMEMTRINPDCNYPSASGDSGSAVFAKINNVWKIIGLLFAGGGTTTSVCRIDYVAKELGIEAWDGTITSTSFIDPSSIQTIITPDMSAEDSLIVNGKIYRQMAVTLNPPTA